MKLPRFLQYCRTLRFYLAFLYAIVFGIIQVGLCLVVLNVRERYLREDFDARLVDRAETMVEAISIRAGAAGSRQERQRAQPRLNPFRFPGYYFQIRTETGEFRERSRNLRKASLPLSDSARAARFTGQAVLETVDSDEVGFAAEHPGQLRLLTLYHDERDVDPFYLQVGASLTPVEDSVAELRGLFAMVVPAGLLIAAIASWALARRSLAPIGEIARQARDFTAAHLDRRIQTRPRGDEVAELTAVINGMLDRLEASFRAQERFVADASHELKTPLSVVLAEAQVLRQQVRETEAYDQFISSVQDQLRQLVRLVDSLLTLARADAGFPLAEVQPVSMNEIVMEAVERCEPLARHQEVRIVPTLAPPAPDGAEAYVSGDPALLRSVIDNLIRNAIRYSPAEEAVEVDVAMDGTDVQVSVRDQGPGIPPEELDRVFERFFSIPRGQPSAQGAGLGLAIARGVASLHHGSITAANRPGGGCEFVLQLPQTSPDSVSG
jgi:signal transduction histidine kinase